MNSSRKSKPETKTPYENSWAQAQAAAALEIRRRDEAKVKALRETIEGWSKNFPAFAKKLDVIDKYGERIPVAQSPILKAFEIARTGRDYVLKPRQVFMTTWELARDIWFFFVNPNAHVTILCQSSNDNAGIKELSNRIQVMFEGLRRNYPDAPFAKITETKWVRTDAGPDGQPNRAELKIVGAGATEKAAGKKGRAETIHRLHVTEISSFEFAFETLVSMLACIPPQDRVKGPLNGELARTEITFESTAKGAAGAFFDGYMSAKEGKDEYTAHFFPWFQQPEYQSKLQPDEVVVPRTERENQLVTLHKITSEQLKWYQQQIANPMKGGQANVDQEYPSDEESCWLFDGRMFFDKDALSKLRTAACEAGNKLLHGACRIWHQPEAGKTYILAIDPSSGAEIDESEAKKKKLDPTAFVVLERESGKHCATFHGYFHPDDAAEKAGVLGWYYNQAAIVVERSSSHITIHIALEKWVRRNAKGEPDPTAGIGYPNIYVAEDRHYGFAVTPQSRAGILDGLEVAIRTGAFKTYDIEFIKEALLFIVKDEKAQAAAGAHDDRIMAAAIAWKLISIPIGLNCAAFAQPPSIAFEQTPISFEGMAGNGIDSLVNQERARWAGANQGSASGWATLLNNNGSTEGF